MKGSTVRCLVLGFALVPALVAAQSGKVQLSLTDTGVTLVAQNATPREILTEWKRVTGATVVGLEGLGGTPLTLRLENVSEREALDAVLRATAGRMYVDRDQPASGQSQFDRIVVVPARSKPAAATRAAAAAPPQVPARANQPEQNMDQVGVDAVFEEQNAAAEAEAEQALAEAAGESAAEGEQAEAWGSSPTPVPAPTSPVVGPDEEVTPPTSTDFDYANPQRYFQMRARQMQERLRARREAGANTSQSQTGSVYVPGGQSSGGVTVVGGGNAGSSGSTQPTAPGTSSGASSGTSSVPRATPTPTPNQGAQDAGTQDQTPNTPYGLPSNVLPGSQAPPPGSPAYQGRYFNPYLPAGQQAGQSGQKPPQQPRQQPPQE